MIHITADPADPALRQKLLLETVCRFRPELSGVNLAICRSEQGKPWLVFAETGRIVENLHFSISHSGDLWGCVVSDRPCGLDLQQVRPADCDRLAERFFTKEEQSYVLRFREQGFFEIWVRWEALAKYTGLGFFGMGSRRPSLVRFSTCSSMPVWMDNLLLLTVLEDSVTWNGKKVLFEKVEVPEGYMAVWCHEEEKEGDAQ